MPGGRPPKDNPSGLDGALGQVAQQVKTGRLAGIEDFGRARGLSVRSGSFQVVLGVEPGSEASVADAVVQAGGQAEAVHELLVQALAPPQALESLAQIPGVRFVRTPFYGQSLGPISESAATMGLETWHQAGLRGRSVKVAILDLGFDGFWNVLGSDIPAEPVLRSFRADGDLTGGGDTHGTAAAELVYDVAPEATFYLVNFATEVELGNAVDWLISEHVNVISSSVGWPGTGFGDGTGTVNSTVAKAEKAGITWVQASGNYAHTHWTGFFNDPDGNGFHNFSGADEGNTISLRRARPTEERIFRVEIFLTWDDSNQDYDLFLFRGEGVVAQSTAFQNGRFPAVEHIVYTTASTGDFWIGVQQFRANRHSKLDLIVTIDYNLEYRVAQESLVVPADSPAAITVGAVEPGTLNVRSYSSQGPTKDGRIKPDLVAGDGVTTVTYGPGAFSGTSAAAPVVAGAVALVLSARPSMTPAAVKGFLQQRAIGPGFGSRNTMIGAGRVFMGQLPGVLFLPIVPRGAAVFPGP